MGVGNSTPVTPKKGVKLERVSAAAPKSRVARLVFVVIMLVVATEELALFDRQGFDASIRKTSQAKVGNFWPCSPTSIRNVRSGEVTQSGFPANLSVETG